METRYNPSEIEPKWQTQWRARNLFDTTFDPDKPKFYYLDMFPYPSGALHVGHVRNYAIGDAVARYRVMNGYNVLHPMGWDAFGLPAENAAIKNGVHPAQWTDKCIEQMHEQFDKLGIAFDWSREIATCKPDYYKWTQWLWIQLYNAGLIERKSALVNWCPNDQTVLANEQVKDGKCDRCGHLVEQKELTQWFANTPAYAQRLLDDLETLTDWPERVIKAQRDWIGRSEGTTFRFPLRDREGEIEVFTTRVDTVFGVTYMVMAPDAPLVDELVAGTEWAGPAREFRDHVARQKDAQRDRSTDFPKEGMFTGAYCTNPMNGEAVPIWLANYVVSDYGSGAVMAVPAHDERDFDFAKKYDLEIRTVILPPDKFANECFIQDDEDVQKIVKHLELMAKEDYSNSEILSHEEVNRIIPDVLSSKQAGAYTDKYAGKLTDSDEFEDLNSVEARATITDYMETACIGEATVNYRLRPWCMSRQRYWGCPIPIVYREDGALETVPLDQLPVLLPTDVQFTGHGNPLETSASWQDARDSEGNPARRETDTLDTFVDSSWYFLRFCSPHDDSAPFNPDDLARWMAVDQYVGGVEHATMHLIYARFFTKVLFDLGLVQHNEPFPRLFTQGMVTMAEPESGRVSKMSKSKGNVVALDDAVAQYGADATRLMTLFMGPPDQDVEWKRGDSDAVFAGTYRFLERVWRACLAQPFDANWRDNLGGETGADKKLRRKTHQTIERVSVDIERFNMNTAIAALMEEVNALQEWLNGKNSNAAVYGEAVENLLLLLSPFAPHIADELGSQLGFDKSFYRMSWPRADTDVAKEDEVVIPVQVNGKLKARLTVEVGLANDVLEGLALGNVDVAAAMEGKVARKVVVVPGRLVNIVV